MVVQRRLACSYNPVLIAAFNNTCKVLNTWIFIQKLQTDQHVFLDTHLRKLNRSKATTVFAQMVTFTKVLDEKYI